MNVISTCYSLLKRQATTVRQLWQNILISLLFSWEQQISIKRRFVVCSSVIFLFMFIVGSTTFIISMEKIQLKNIGSELTLAVELERRKLEAFTNREIALAMKMAGSPLIKRHLLNNTDSELQKIAFEEIAEYRKAFASNNVFLINDRDKKYYFNNAYVYTLDQAAEGSEWYDAMLKNPSSYQIKVNFDPGINKTLVWIDALVYDTEHKPVGIVGTGVNLSDFADLVYQDYRGLAELYLFNSAGEITGARDVRLIADKVRISEALGPCGEEMLAAAKGLRDREIIHFEIQGMRGLVAVGSIPDLDLHIAALRHLTLWELLYNGMTALFCVMMAALFLCFLVSTLIVVGILTPFDQLTKKIFELELPQKTQKKDRLASLGEFFNMAIIDPLTGLYNRRYMDGNLNKAIKSLARNGGKLSVLMMDIDYFKKYNDTYGHEAGDTCLKIVAATLAKCVTREGDFVARYGGEEFAVILPNTDEHGARTIAEKMSATVRQCNILHETSEAAKQVTISVGGVTSIAHHQQHGKDYIRCADKALYESKKNGRDRCTLFRHLPSGEDK